MKKTIITIMMAAMFTASGFATQVKAAGDITSTSAETTATTEVTYKDEAGITPDSILYPIDKLIDKVEVIISFTDEGKVEALLDNAQERLGESEAMAEAGNNEATEDALSAYDETVTQADDILDEIVEENQDSEDEQKSEEVAELEEAVAEQQETSTEVLENLKDEVTGDSEQILSRVLEMQTAKKAAVRAMVDARHELNAARKAYNAAKVQLAKAEKSGDEEAITAAEEALKTAEEALNTEKTEYKTAFEAKQETVKKYAGSKAVENDEEAQDENKTDEDATPEDVADENTTSEDAEQTTETATEDTNAAEASAETAKVKETKKAASSVKAEEKKSQEVKEQGKVKVEENTSKVEKAKENKGQAVKAEVKKEETTKANAGGKSDKAAVVENSGKGNKKN